MKEIVKIHNMSENHYRYVLAFLLDNDYWYYGSDNDISKAYRVSYENSNSYRTIKVFDSENTDFVIIE